MAFLIPVQAGRSSHMPKANKKRGEEADKTLLNRSVSILEEAGKGDETRGVLYTTVC